MTVTTDVYTDSGTIQIVHTVTLGELLIGGLLGLILLFLLIRAVMGILWR